MSRELVCFKAKQRLFSLHEQSMNLKREKCVDNSSLYTLRKHPFLLALRHGGTFCTDERLRLSDRNSILITQINV